MTAALWVPSPERAGATAMAQFRAAAGFDDYESLHRWSVAEPEAFWAQVWETAGMIGERGAQVFVRGQSIVDARFFPEARLNAAENLLARSGDDEAVVALDEDGGRRALTWDQLREEVGACSRAMTQLGVGPGDRVAALLPNSLEAVVTMLSASSIGAVFSSTSPDFGAAGVIDRFAQISPTVLVTTDGYRYGGRRYDTRERVAEVAAALPSVRQVVRTGEDWDRFLAPYRGSEPAFERRAFDHPWYVLFSSGTTGVPKCIVHRSGGVLIQHRKEHLLHCDVRAGDRVLYFTTTGWMMWNWLASVLAGGATAVLYDGSPMHPGPEALVDIAEAERLTLLGVSARYLSALRKSGCRPTATHRLDALRTVCSTGSPLGVDEFEFVYADVKSDVHLASISGGADLCSCFVLGDPTGAVHGGEIQCPGLGMAVDVVDDTGSSLSGRPGVRGELVCDDPFPSMPLGFWGDETGARYRSAYFERISGRWAHGDFAAWTVHGGLVISGRSDTTLNPGGVRIGTAELYREVERMPEVVESLAFGQDIDGDTRVVLLVCLADGVVLDDDLCNEIRHRIRVGCSPRHSPAVIAAVDDLPRTRSGKLAEMAVADAVNGRPVRNTDALANPESLTAILSIIELAS